MMVILLRNTIECSQINGIMIIFKLKYYRLWVHIGSLAGAILMVCFFAQSGFAANKTLELRRDTASKIEVRTFSQTQLNKYRSSPDFQYISNKPEALTWWDRVKQWFFQKLVDIIQFSTETNLGKTILILLAIAFIIYAAYKMIGADKTGLWAKKNPESVFQDLTDENIHTIDFDRLINDAAAENNYRLAIRLWYLKTLKNLSGKNFISWKPGKTNYEYVAELEQTQYKVPFNKLTHDFEYSWYGEAAVTSGEYGALKEQFANFNQQLR